MKNLILLSLIVQLTLWSGLVESAYLTMSNETCAIPFQYQGKAYYKCVSGANGRSWCAITDPNYDVKGAWNWCQDKPTADEEQCENMRTPNITVSDVKVILEEHNNLRKYVNSTLMMKLKWSNALAKRAQYFAESCSQVHAETTRCDGQQVGQNFVVQKGINGHPDPQGWVTTIRLDWGENERRKFNVATGACSGDGVCGHYEQVVWAHTEEVGCGMSMCVSKDDKTFPYYVVYACHYSPMGRLSNVKAYTEGTPCSGCAAKAYPHPYKCDDKFCEICSDPKDTSCASNDCRDLVDCSFFADQFCSNPTLLKSMETQTPSTYGYLKRSCQKSCNFCNQ
jgi:hypothetical protein